jgi:chromosome segregation ATPase
MKKPSSTLSNTSPTESYYVVPVGADLTAENASLKESLKQTTQALEAYSGTFERQKDAIKSSLAQLRSELQAIEHAKVQELNAKIEELQTENDRLKIQMGRMKSRWEGLKESARKRR